MSFLTAGRERFTGSTRGTRLDLKVHQHHCESSRVCATIKGDHCVSRTDERPAPECTKGFGSDPHRNMYHPRAEAVPSYRTLPGSVGERIVSLSDTLRKNRGLGRSESKDACCERCSATLVALKKQALSLSVHHHFSCQDTSDLCAFLQDNLRVHSRSSPESRDRGRELGKCATCGTMLSQLKREAAHLALNGGHELPGARTAAPLGDRSASQPHGLNQSPRTPRSPRTPQRTPQTLRRRLAKPPNQDTERAVEEQRRASPDGVAFYPHHQASDNAVLRCSDVVHAASKLPHLSKVVSIANSAAMSFLARAAEKLNLTSRRKGQLSHAASARLSDSYRDLIQKTPPAVPPCLLQAAIRTKDSPNVGKVKVVLRVNPATSEGQPQVLHIDPTKKRAILLEPMRQSPPRAKKTSSRDLLKAFHYDAVYPQDSSQTEVCAGVLTDAIRCVLSGSDGCVLGMGCADVGSWSSMLGNAESVHKLGLIPCAISWLYGAIEKRREKTWTDLTVSVSAVELCCGEEDTLRDLLGEVVPPLGGVQDSPRAHIRLQEDPVHGIQLRNHNRVKAPSAERAASLLDVAIAARRHNDFTTFLSHSSIMFFTLHVQPPRTQESGAVGKGARGPTKLTLIDVCGGMRGGVGYIRNKLPHSDLGPVVLSLLSGHKTIPKKGSKLTMLLRESLSHANCHTAVVAQVANSLAQLHETTSVIQLASRIRRTQKRTKQSGSCSPGGRSLTRQKRGPPSFSLRAFHSTDEVDVDVQRFRLRGELDEGSGSERSCDTVIQIDSDGSIRPRAPPKLAKPEFVPIIPSLHPYKADTDDPEFTALLQELLKIPKLRGENEKDEAQGQTEMPKAEMKKPERDCLKCDTFAELQERLGCIDGEETTDLLKAFSRGPPANNAAQKSPSNKETGKQATAETPPPQTLKPGLGFGQTSGREKQTDGAFGAEHFQREDSGLYDCEECSATSSSEEPPNQTLNRTAARRYQFPKTGAIQSADTLRGATDACIQPTGRRDSQEAADWFKADNRTSPVGKSLPASPPSPPRSPSKHLQSGSPFTDVAAKDLQKDAKEMTATITVTVQQPLDFRGQDELVFSMVEEVTIGALDGGRTGGNVICIKDTTRSTARPQGSAGAQPIRIIGNITEEDPAAASHADAAHGAFVRPGGAATGKGTYPSRRERSLPSFINPMPVNADERCRSDDTEERRTTGTAAKCPPSASGKICNPSGGRISRDAAVLERGSFRQDSAESKTSDEGIRNIDKSHHGDWERVYSADPPKALLGDDSARPRVGKSRVAGATLGCLETSAESLNTGSLPRSWLNANRHVAADGWRDPRGLTSSTPCSPGATLERRRGEPSSPAGRNLRYSPPLKYETDYKREAGRPLGRGVGLSFESSKVGMKHDHTAGRVMSPLEESGSLFPAERDPLTGKSLGRNACNLPSFDRGGSYKKGSDCSGKGARKGDCTIPRASKTSRKTRQASHGHSRVPSETETHPRPAHSKLSAVGKLKLACPKVRRLSAPSIKNLSLPRKGPQQAINRSASLSPDGKTVNFERTSSWVSSSPPASFRSISRTPSQSSARSSAKSAIQGFANGRVSDFLKERPERADPTGCFPSPYSQVTSPRTPPHMSGHASDTTSVLSGDLPPAMGKTSLYFSNRRSTMSSGYDSLVRDGEAAASCASNGDSVSDGSGSLLREAHGGRSSQRRGHAGAHPRHVSSDAPLAARQSSSGLQSGRADQGIPEDYDVKVYRIDNAQAVQKKATRPLQRQQATLFGAQAGDQRRHSPVPQIEQRSGAGRIESRAGAQRAEFKRQALAEFRGEFSGAPGGP
ncbi:LOW QUALITY PROTEIN: kinesin-like protein KIF26B [Hippocampus zosterae]|uniref:LOW QUALITY PROTEIN: kinesin-like protein KIF26B n=1 Tax=Hippocampus zosterae TaxID=109293 RepID=UPI00223D8A72|nr:LOW QUALITY PROTEIN: kinesin-like protein KIF26B [Hippocampus zosterae]